MGLGDVRRLWDSGKSPWQCAKDFSRGVHKPLISQSARELVAKSFHQLLDERSIGGGWAKEIPGINSVELWFGGSTAHARGKRNMRCYPIRERESPRLSLVAKGFLHQNSWINGSGYKVSFSTVELRLKVINATTKNMTEKNVPRQNSEESKN